MTVKKLPLGAYHTITQTQADGSEKVAAHVFAVDGDPDIMHRNFQLFSHAEALHSHLTECLDTLYNETHGQEDTPYLADVKKRCTALLGSVPKVSGYKLTLAADERASVVKMLQTVLRHIHEIPAFDDTIGVPKAFAVSAIRQEIASLNLPKKGVTSGQ